MTARLEETTQLEKTWPGLGVAVRTKLRPSSSICPLVAPVTEPRPLVESVRGVPELRK